MTYQARINVMPLKELLDPQGKTIHQNLKNINVHKATDVRVGKHIVMTFDGESETEVIKEVETACKELLTNRIVEFYEYELHLIE